MYMDDADESVEEETQDKEVNTGFKLSNKTYDTLKWITTILLPALASLYFGLAGIWGFPYVEQVVGTITVVITFSGIILGISSVSYSKINSK